MVGIRVMVRNTRAGSLFLQEYLNHRLYSLHTAVVSSAAIYNDIIAI